MKDEARTEALFLPVILLILLILSKNSGSPDLSFARTARILPIRPAAKEG